MQLELKSKRAIQKIAEETGDLIAWLVTKLLIKLRQFQRIQNKIIQKQLQMSMINKYLEEEEKQEEIQETFDELRLK